MKWTPSSAVPVPSSGSAGRSRCCWRHSPGGWPWWRGRRRKCGSSPPGWPWRPGPQRPACSPLRFHCRPGQRRPVGRGRHCRLRGLARIRHHCQHLPAAQPADSGNRCMTRPGLTLASRVRRGAVVASTRPAPGSPSHHRERARNRTARTRSRAAAAASGLTPASTVPRDQQTALPAGPLRGHERQHIHRTDPPRRLAHHGEEDLQVIRHGHRVRPAPASQELQVLIQQPHPEPHHKITRGVPRPGQAHSSHSHTGLHLHKTQATQPARNLMKITRITCRSGRRSADDRERSHTQITQFGTAPSGPRGDHVADHIGGYGS